MWLLMWSRCSEGSCPPHTMHSRRPAFTSYSMRNSCRNQACRESLRYRSRVCTDGPGSSCSSTCCLSWAWRTSAPSQPGDTSQDCSCSWAVAGSEASAVFTKYETQHWLRQRFHVNTSRSVRSLLTSCYFTVSEFAIIISWNIKLSQLYIIINPPVMLQVKETCFKACGTTPCTFISLRCC